MELFWFIKPQDHWHKSHFRFAWARSVLEGIVLALFLCRPTPLPVPGQSAGMGSQYFKCTSCTTLRWSITFMSDNTCKHISSSQWNFSTSHSLITKQLYNPRVGQNYPCGTWLFSLTIMWVWSYNWIIVLFFKTTYKPLWHHNILENQFNATHSGTNSSLQCWSLFHQQAARSCCSFRPGNAKIFQVSPTIPTLVLTFPLSALSAELRAMPHKKC